MKSCALLTCDDLEQFIHDEHFLEQALKQKGWSYTWIPWRSENVDWSRFDCAIVRTTWDYTSDIAQFLKTLEVINQADCSLFNDFETIKWNSDKKYLNQLREQAIPVIPTQWIEDFRVSQAKNYFENLAAEQVVFKPQVGAGGFSTFVMSMDEISQRTDDLKELEGRAVMAQPLVNEIHSQGEYSAHFFGGEFSHCVCKKPGDGEFRSQEEYGSNISVVQLSDVQMQLCQQVLKALPSGTLFARIDFIPEAKGLAGMVIEVELIEPSLYFRYDDNSAGRLVESLEKLMNN